MLCVCGYSEILRYRLIMFDYVHRFFFFQAEDGIRDVAVTGVQTCALPIYRQHHPEPGRYTWWDYRAGNFHKNFGMRIDRLLVSAPLAGRAVWAEIDREARKGKPIPSDHAPLVIDIDAPGCPFDAGWASAEERI